MTLEEHAQIKLTCYNLALQTLPANPSPELTMIYAKKLADWVFDDRPSSNKNEEITSESKPIFS